MYRQDGGSGAEHARTSRFSTVAGHEAGEEEHRLDGSLSAELAFDDGGIAGGVGGSFSI
jgi:hypothetical protein